MQPRNNAIVRLFLKYITWQISACRRRILSFSKNCFFFSK